jgi:6-phosphofructokinase 1
VFVIEVMGRNTGHLALETALACGAEYVVIPEVAYKSRELLQKIKAGIRRGKAGSIVVVAEKDNPGHAFGISKQIEKAIHREVRTLILGHLQRGGSPTMTDRNIASQFGAKAVEMVVKKKNKLMVGVRNGEIVATPFTKALKARKKPKRELMKLIDILSI